MALDSSATYGYRILFVNESNYQSDYFQFTATTGIGETSLVLKNLPVIPEDISGLSRVFYRTEGNGATYKYLMQDSGRSISYIDSDADANLGAAYAAPSTLVDNSSLVYSDIGKPSKIPVLNFLPVYPDDGDVITGIVDAENRILVFKKNSIRQVITDGNPLNWRVETITDKIGCDDPGSIKVAKDKIYFRTHKQIYRFPDTLGTPLSLPKKNTLDTGTFVDAAYVTSFSWYIFILRYTDTEKIFVYDEKVQTWYEFTSSVNQWECIIEKEFGSDRGTILSGHDGMVYITKYVLTDKRDFSDLATSAQITAYLMSKLFTVKDSTQKIRLRKIFSSYKKTDSLDVTHTLINPQVANNATNTDSTNSTLTDDYKEYDKVTDQFTNAIKETNKIQYLISGQGLEEFNSARLEYRTLNRGKRN